MAHLKRRSFLLGALIVVLTLVSAGLFIGGKMFRPSGAYAQIQYDGREVLTIRLDTPGVYTLDEDQTVRFVVKNGGIAFCEATCADKICEKTGFLSKEGETAACLPRKTVVRVVAAREKKEADAIAG